MKYAIIGLGAVGSVLGFHIATAGQEIILIGKKDQVEVIKKDGITLNGKQITKNIIATNDFSILSDVDILFVCVKSQDTLDVADSAKKHLKKSAIIISIQNGVRNKEILEKNTNITIFSGVVLFNAVYNKPGDISLTMKGGFILEHDKKCSMVYDLLKKAGFKITLNENIKGVQYSKLVLNLQIAVTALTGQTIKESIQDKTTRIINVATLKEGIDILQKSGIKISTLPGIDPKRMIRILSTSGMLSSILSKVFLGLKKDAKNSMLQSLLRGKTTEIEFINGEIVSLAKQNNLQAPINEKLVELVKKAEKNKKTPKITPDKLKELLEI